MNEEAVRTRAREIGVAVDWTDAMGRPQRVSTEALRRILDSLDGGDRPGGSLPPLVTAEVKARVPLPDLPGADKPAELAMEGGTIRPVRLKNRQGVMVAPAIDRPGYHRLRFADREITIAVAPPRCVTLDEIGEGRRMWGVSAQVYGLRRAGDGGIGDATAVRQLAEGAARAGADAVALSPVHSLFSADDARYGPYSPSSRLFLNPLFADPSAVFGAERIAACGSAPNEDFETAKLIDWRPAARAKFERLARLFADFVARDLGGSTALADDFNRFVKDGGERLHEHALFEALDARGRTAEPALTGWQAWPEGWKHPADSRIAGYLEGDADAMRYHMFLQWLAARSFAAAQAGAREAGMRIGLIADLAIGMDPAGSHAWARQSDLLLGLSVGAPPDEFNARGQDWGLTAFSPQALVARGFEPFLATLRAALGHSGGLRIDHVMGLMRLWLVPRGSPSSEGAYLAYPLEDLLRLLALESHRHRAVVIGEDLGTVPPGFRARLRRAGIAGMDVLWFQRTRAAFTAPSRWRPDAVAMTTTHDLPTVAGWWRGADLELRGSLGLTGPAEADQRRLDRPRLWRSFHRAGLVEPTAPPPDRPDSVVDAALAYVAQAPARLMLAPLEDLLGVAEQPNLPGTIDEHPNWRRRLDPTAQDLFEMPQVKTRTKLIADRRR